MMASGASSARMVPWWSTATRSTRSMTTSMWCSTMSTVHLWSRCMRRMTSDRPGTSARETPAIGSSRRITLGFIASRTAISNLRLSPWLRPPAASSRKPSSPTCARCSRAIAVARSSRRGKRSTERLPPSSRWAARRTFSSTLRPGNRLDVWKVRPRPALARWWMESWVMSRPARSTRPAVGRWMPEIMLNSVVLPAPLGPMTPIISPAGTAMLTSVRMVIPPTAKLRSVTLSAAEVGVMVGLPGWWPARGGRGPARGSGSAGLGRGDVLARHRGDQLGDPAALTLDEAGLVHRLDECVVRLADRVLTLGPLEGPALECADHRVDVLPAGLGDGVHDHLGGGEAVRGEQVGGAGGGLDVLDHRGVDRVVRGAGEVVVEEVDLLRGLAVGVEGGRVAQAGDDRDVVEHALLVERLPHGAGGGSGPGDEDHVRVRVEHLRRERGELGDVLGDHHRADLGARGPEDALDGHEVALAESVVLGQHEHLGAGDGDERAGRGDVLQGLATGAEGVVVDAGDRVRGSRAGDVEHLVLCRLLGQGQRHAGGRGAGHDLVALPDDVTGSGDRAVGRSEERRV